MLVAFNDSVSWENVEVVVMTIPVYKDNSVSGWKLLAEKSCCSTT